jgi:heat shock protein HslJ
MNRIPPSAVLAALLAVPAAAQEVPREFPLDKSYKAISIGTSDMQNAGITFRIARGPDGRVRGSGSAGCNRWIASAVIREHTIEFSPIMTTKMFCDEPHMRAEQEFLRAIQSARRWRMDSAQLIIEGDAAPLVLAASANR